MIDFSTVKSLTIPEGVVTKVEHNGTVLWQVRNNVTYTNVIPLSINKDGSDYVGTNGEDGYKVGYRIKSNESDYPQSGICITGYIPITNYEEILFLSNIEIKSNDSGHTQVVLYDNTFTRLGVATIKNMYSSKDAAQLISEGLAFSDDGNLISISPLAMRWWLTKATVAKTAYIRFAAQTITNKSVITINEAI